MLRDYLLTIVEVIGAVQCLFIAFALLYLPGERTQASRWLAALFLVWALLFTHMALRQNDLEYLAPLAGFLRLPLLFLSGPLLFLYLKQVTARGAECNLRRTLPHLAPFALVLLAYVPSLALDRNGLLQTLYYGDLRGSFAYTADISATQQWLLAVSRVVLRLFVLHLLAYVVLCLRLLGQHKRRMREQYSRLDKVSLDWLRNLLYALVLLWISAGASQFVFAGGEFGRLLNDLQVPALVLFFPALGIYGLLQKSISLADPAQQDDDSHAAGVAYRSNGFTEAQQLEAARRLESLMTKARPYLDGELTLTGLATVAALPPRRLSQVINGHFGQNFVDFVNGYRVEEAKRLLADRGCERSVLTIAMDVGFNSKSAFYSAFKRHTGQTPTQFRADCLASMPAPQA